MCLQYIPLVYSPLLFSPSSPSFVPTGGTGEKDRAPISHESFLLMANSQTDMDDWVKAIRRVIWAPFGGGKVKPLNWTKEAGSFLKTQTYFHL